ncbi:extracellular solute-binding protein [Lysinibacillus agricola]|uniref:Extracellular solute-binding protein n=1 Tax=Lysinibacillus agricola TaxID=2590012 RepID=A0ABX7ATV9_9BACI|nr:MULTISPECIES: extracellular solute-binding protein [Lysinibacillus]KOS61637.1 hypothetical protein AN161_16760 [Lysinibacillus sp. FJAT-14222]QQP12348.1 extracellular solute-binding protein [Lysinibacillus agricola]
MLKKLFIFLLFLIVLSGCSLKSKPLIIAVMAPEMEDSIKNLYAENYDYDIEIKSILPSVDAINGNWVELDKVIDNFLINNKDVDIVYGFTPDYLKGLVEKGDLKNLSTSMDESVLEKIAPAILEPIKQAGKGDVYAVAPYFNNYVLVYNKRIFEQVEVEKPSNSMTWQEISKLATEVQEKSNYKGIALGFPSSDRQFYFLYQSINDPVDYFENKDGKAIVNTTITKKYWKLFADMYKDNSKATGEEFMNGKVSMALLPLGQLIDSEFLKFYADLDKSNWGIVEMPVFEENKGGLAFTDSLFSISKYSDNDEAIKFLEYIQGEKFAKLLTKTTLFPTYWDEEIKDILIQKYEFDLSPAYNQPGALIKPPQFNADKFNEITNVGADYFTQYLKGEGELNKLLSDYEGKINKKK